MNPYKPPPETTRTKPVVRMDFWYSIPALVIVIALTLLLLPFMLVAILCVNVMAFVCASWEYAESGFRVFDFRGHKKNIATSLIR